MEGIVRHLFALITGRPTVALFPPGRDRFQDLPGLLYVHWVPMVFLTRRLARLWLEARAKVKML